MQADRFTIEETHYTGKEFNRWLTTIRLVSQESRLNGAFVAAICFHSSTKGGKRCWVQTIAREITPQEAEVLDDLIEQTTDRYNGHFGGQQ